MTRSADQLEKWLVAPSEPAPLPPHPPCLRMRTIATGVEFRPLPRPLGRFRLFVLLVVDLTRIQPNIQRTALLPNRLVLLTAFPRCLLCPRRLCHRFMVLVCAPSSSFLARLFPLGATGHAMRVVLWICAVVYGGAGPCSRAQGMLLFRGGGGGEGGTCIVTELLIRDSPG